jgi:hypothetical protein
LINPGTNIQDLLAILNNFHASIKFTHEVEENNSLPFLDVKVYRLPPEDPSHRNTSETNTETLSNIQHSLINTSNVADHIKQVKELKIPTQQNEDMNRGRFETTFHRKVIYTGLMTHWFSFVPMQYKVASIANTIQRAISIG